MAHIIHGFQLVDLKAKEAWAIVCTDQHGLVTVNLCHSDGPIILPQRTVYTVDRY